MKQEHQGGEAEEEDGREDGEVVEDGEVEVEEVHHQAAACP